MSSPRNFRSLIQDPACSFLLEAHSAVSARIAAEAGATGLWASSLTLSCLLGLRDTSEMTMTQALEILEAITSTVDIPVLFDGDTGYGHLTHFQQLVEHLIRRKVGGVCIEDKIFPKRNSFIDSEGQELAPIEEFCAKIRAGKDAQTDPDFVIVARTEALITGMDMETALHRSHCYADAGADAILIHSKAKTFAQVKEFAHRWNARLPLICVPTTYPDTAPEEFQQAGISVVIWANHMLRASVSAMKSAAAQIVQQHSIREIEASISSVKELFRLQDADDTDLLEQRYGSSYLQGSRKALILPSTPSVSAKYTPAGIRKLVQSLRAENIRQIGLVQAGNLEDADLQGVSSIDCSYMSEPGTVGQLLAADNLLQGEVVLMDGDVLFRPSILHELLGSTAAITLVVDAGAAHGTGMFDPQRAVFVSEPPLPYAEEKSYRLFDIGMQVKPSLRTGTWIGLIRCQNQGTEALRAAVRTLSAKPDGVRLAWDAVLRHLMKKMRVPVHVLYTHFGWQRMEHASVVPSRLGELSA